MQAFSLINMNFSQILTQKYPDINVQFLEAISPFIQYKTYNKGDYIFKDGDQGFLGFQVEGISRYVAFDDNGNEKTTDFNQAGDFIHIEADTSSWLQAVNANTIAFIPAIQLEKLLTQFPELNKYIAEIYRYCLQLKSEQLEKLMVLNAKQRYEAFLADFPQLSAELQLGQIASYLGINQASLSRIRKDL